jgi:hypothetical protein
MASGTDSSNPEKGPLGQAVALFPMADDTQEVHRSSPEVHNLVKFVVSASAGQVIAA